MPAFQETIDFGQDSVVQDQFVPLAIEDAQVAMVSPDQAQEALRTHADDTTVLLAEVYEPANVKPETAPFNPSALTLQTVVDEAGVAYEPWTAQNDDSENPQPTPDERPNNMPEADNSESDAELPAAGGQDGGDDDPPEHGAQPLDDDDDENEGMGSAEHGQPSDEQRSGVVDARNDGNEQSGEQTAALFREFFDAVRAFNHDPRRAIETGTIILHIGAEESESDPVGLYRQEAEERFAQNPEVQAAGVSLDLQQMQLQETAEELGLGFSPDARNFAAPVIVDGERFAAALPAAETDIDEEMRADIEQMLEQSIQHISNWQLSRQRTDLDARYDRVVMYGTIMQELELPDTVIDTPHNHIIDETLRHVEAYAPKLRDLDIGGQTLPVLEVMSAAAQEGTLTEAALLYEFGVIHSRDYDFHMSYLASWGSDPDAWQMLDEIVEYLSMPDQSTNLRGFLADHLPATLDKMREQYADIDLTQLAPNEPLPEDIQPPDPVRAAFLEQKRNQYRTQLLGS